MKKIPLQELSSLISRYVDGERLILENPHITKEMIDDFFQNISGNHEVTKSGTPSPARHNPPSPKKKLNELIIHTDGASRGNPGKAGAGIAIFDYDYRIIEEICKFLGEATNNVAEYEAMILAAQKAASYQPDKVIFKTDSELLVRQVKGIYRVKNPNLIPLYKKLMTLFKTFPSWEIYHVSREENVLADTLANKGIDSAA
ncbi:MAG: ribonuclease HI family protein [Planctomycetes bacterium]|nr:ribonuclease HI family protein [Planctomycetota bacterium]